MNCSIFCAMVCQSATSRTKRNMSLEKAKAPGVLPKVVATVVLIACIAVARAESIMSRACAIFCGVLLYNKVRSMLPTVWCIRSQIELDCGFLLVDWASLMFS